MTRRDRHLNPLTLATVAGLIVSVGTLTGAILAQPQQPGPQPGQQDEREQAPPGSNPNGQPVQPGAPRPGPVGRPGMPGVAQPGAADDARNLQERNERLRRERAEAMRRLEEGRQPVPNGQPAMINLGPDGLPINQPAGVPGQLGALQPADAPIPAGAEQHLAGDGPIKINLGNEPVELTVFLDYLSLVLGVNIFVDQSLAQQQIIFRAPVEVPKDRLLPLTAVILEDRGFALTEVPLLGYFVRPVASVPLSFEGEEFTTTRVVRTPLARPSSIQTPVTAALGTASASVRITSLDELGILIVTGAPRTVSTVEELIDRILEELVAQELHRFDLRYVEAGYARSRMLALNGRLGGSGATAIPTAPGSAPVIAGGSLSSLDSRLIVDTGNRLIFRGSQDERDQVAQLVEMVDVVTPLISRRYSAGSVAADVATAGEREGLGPVNQTQAATTGAGGVFGGRQGAPGAGGGAEAEVNTSGFTVDADGGSIIYYGTEQQHARVAELVKTFTEQLIGSRIDIKMYKLHNADAESVAELIEALIEDPSQETGSSPFLPQSRVQGVRAQRTRPAPVAAAADGTTDSGAAAGGEQGALATLLNSEAEISIVADPDRNQILVKAPARQQAEIEQIIKRLDQRQPQVFIEAMIVSVTTSDDFNWTVEAQINAGQFLIFSNFGLSGAGTAPPGGQAAQGVRTVPTGNRGVTSAVIKSDFLPYVINTLQSETNARIESNPRILVNDNQQGSVSSDREEPFATTTQGTATTTTGQGGVARAGTTLEVTPRISEGGYISLEYSVELSSFVGNPSAGLQPPRQTENYDSQVTVPSDSTIVVGGFTLSSSSESDSGIPLLKDIPILGNLFKGYGASQRRTTIFVFITPRVMTDPNFIDLRLVTEGPLNKMKVRGETPELQPAQIPLTGRSMLRERSVPANQAPVGP